MKQQELALLAKKLFVRKHEVALLANTFLVARKLKQKNYDLEKNTENRIAETESKLEKDFENRMAEAESKLAVRSREHAAAVLAVEKPEGSFQTIIL